MLDSIYVGLTGLLGFSRDLTIIGNNVANLNTPGFKSSQLLFSDLFYRSQFSDTNRDGTHVRLDIGSGLATNSTRIVFSQGDLKQTGNAQDAAISGSGFFVLSKGGQIFYTRAGQFSFDGDGFLISQSQSARVQALSGGSLHDINILGARTNTGKATTKVNFSGILDSTSDSFTPFVVKNITVYDSAGVSHTLSASFTNDKIISDGSWLVEVKDEKQNLLASGEIRFNADGTPAVAFNTLDVSLTGDNNNFIEFFFGDPGSVSGVRSISASSSNVAPSSQDGFGIGSLTNATFDDKGTLILTYSNGETKNGDRIALASFNFLQGLQEVQGSLFISAAHEVPLFGFAKEGPFGSITGGSVELANVDLAQQFSDLIISQRGYQASSQVISTANDMIQQLFDMKAKR